MSVPFKLLKPILLLIQKRVLLKYFQACKHVPGKYPLNFVVQIMGAVVVSEVRPHPGLKFNQLF